ncbi:hypothetical protein F4811DRAFT_534579 [Daldinia bambusicola]|nr:hypothetical protein F4811DRAFT_534579 [Daldinia bambusicola]
MHAMAHRNGSSLQAHPSSFKPRDPSKLLLWLLWWAINSSLVYPQDTFSFVFCILRQDPGVWVHILLYKKESRQSYGIDLFAIRKRMALETCQLLHNTGSNDGSNDVPSEIESRGGRVEHLSTLR